MSEQKTVHGAMSDVEAAHWRHVSELERAQAQGWFCGADAWERGCTIYSAGPYFFEVTLGPDEAHAVVSLHGYIMAYEALPMGLSEDAALLHAQGVFLRAMKANGAPDSPLGSLLADARAKDRFWSEFKEGLNPRREIEEIPRPFAVA